MATRLRPGRHLALIATPLLLLACSPPGPVGGEAAAPPPAPVASVDTVKTETPASIGTVPSVATPHETEKEASGPGFVPEALIGLDRIALQRKIGAPSWRRREGRTEVWQYQGESCVMDAFLYVTATSGGTPEVTYVELRRNGVAILNDPEDRRACYAEAVAVGTRDRADRSAEP